MRLRLTLVAFLVAAGCTAKSPGGTRGPSSSGDNDMAAMPPAHPMDMAGSPHHPGGPGPGMPGQDLGGVHGDMTLPSAPDDHGDAGTPGHLADGGVFMPPPPNADMSQVQHPPVTNGSFTTYGSGTDFSDVSTDEGGGIWGASANKVYYFVGSKTYGYDQSSGLAQGKTTWTDTYWFGTPTAPATEKVSFTSVAGGMPGEVVVGNIGYIADRLDVDAATGAVRDVVGLQVTSTQQPNPTELAAQQQREVASWKVALDLNGTFNGTTYMGGWHGTAAFHGMSASRTSGICGQGCADYEEHVHPFSSDGNDVFGGDVHAVTITPEGDVWLGDRKAIYFLPQRSQGTSTDLFTNFAIPGQSATYLQPFPGVTDEWNWAIAVDGSHGIYVASYGNGLVYLTANTYKPTYWSSADKLPDNYLTGVVIDASGDVWIGTHASGVARYRPSTGEWFYYTTVSGLPSNDIRAVWHDKYKSPGGVYFATDNGIAVYQ